MDEAEPAPRIDYAALKSGGIIMQRDDDYFSIRLRLPGGSVSADQLPKIAEVAKKYGRGTVRLTARQGIEIPWIRFKEIESARRELAEAGLDLGACGPRFRAIIACPGSDICKLGLVDSQSFAMKIDKEFGGKLVPYKFKTSVSGCPNACSRPLENDLGFVGTVEPELDADACMGCGLCVDICKEKAITLQDGKPVLDKSACVYCGDCIQLCINDAWKTKRIGYSVFAGGKMGRHPQLGDKVADFVGEEEGMEIIRRCLDFYIQQGRKRERLGDVIRRLGFERFAGIAEGCLKEGSISV